MTARNYSSTALATALAQPVLAGDTSITVRATTNFPLAPFTVILDPETLSMEVVTVTAVVGGGPFPVLNVTRGEDGTNAVNHAVGAVAFHGVSARDFSPFQSLAEAWVTFVPVFTAGSPTFTATDAAYMQVGKTLFVRCSVTVNAVGSGSYAMQLPNGTTAKTAMQVLYGLKNTGTPLSVMPVTGTLTTIKFVTSAGVTLGSSNVSSGDVVQFTGVFEVA